MTARARLLREIDVRIERGDLGDAIIEDRWPRSVARGLARLGTKGKEDGKGIGRGPRHPSIE